MGLQHYRLPVHTMCVNVYNIQYCSVGVEFSHYILQDRYCTNVVPLLVTTYYTH
jgi:hypothetical protein